MSNFSSLSFKLRVVKQDYFSMPLTLLPHSLCSQNPSITVSVIWPYFILNTQPSNIQIYISSSRRSVIIINIFIKHGVMAAEKEVLNQKGLAFGDCRRPFAPISEEGKREIAERVMPLL